MTPLILSADDYALNVEVDDAILDLIRRGLLTATSCLVLSPRWPQAARLLDADIRARAGIGLHLDFTEFAGSARHALPVLIARAVTGTLPRKQLCQCIEAQLDRFEDATGNAPDYVDGHQHVHQLPQIREALIASLARRYGAGTPWIRLANPTGNSLKEKIIRALGAQRLAALAEKAGLPCSDWLLGVYDFGLDEEAYRARLARWLAQAAEPLPGICALMCHPAAGAKQVNDPIGQARIREYAVLATALKGLLNQFGLKPVRGVPAGQAWTADAEQH